MRGFSSCPLWKEFLGFTGFSACPPPSSQGLAPLATDGQALGASTSAERGHDPYPGIEVYGFGKAEVSALE